VFYEYEIDKWKNLLIPKGFEKGKQAFQHKTIVYADYSLFVTAQKSAQSN
jgi:hypothetical protein